MLQGKVVWEINQRWLKHVWFLRNAEDTFMVKLALTLTAAVFAPSELCPNGYMYISHRGIVLYGGRVLTSGKVWGEDMILSSPALRSKYAARCMTYVEVYVISRDELLDLAKQFPATLRIVRRSSFRLAFRREMIRRAQENLNAVRKFDPTSATSPTMVRSIKRASAVPASLDTASNRMLMAVSSQSSFSEDDGDELETVNMASPMGTGDATLNHEALQAFDTNMLQEHRRLLAQVQEISSQLNRLDEKRIIISAGHRARTAG
jgi:CRP-like cAMP-binding protein